ncbi:MAG: hypothetical protein ACT4P1_17090 [Sporichthyaceae bacterium]
MGLRRAYATLGVHESASLETARAAYATWSSLLTDPSFGIDPGIDSEVTNRVQSGGGDTAQAVLARHELDLAWYAIEQAHAEGSLSVRRPRGCSECGALPAVRITFSSVRGAGLRTKRATISALVCQECGIAACNRAQRETWKRGWWSLLGVFFTLRALARNASERRFLRHIEPPQRPRRRTDADLYEVPRRRFAMIPGRRRKDPRAA